jgi:hypothetical protein
LHPPGKLRGAFVSSLADRHMAVMAGADAAMTRAAFARRRDSRNLPATLRTGKS